MQLGRVLLWLAASCLIVSSGEAVPGRQRATGKTSVSVATVAPIRGGRNRFKQRSNSVRWIRNNSTEDGYEADNDSAGHVSDTAYDSGSEGSATNTIYMNGSLTIFVNGSSDTVSVNGSSTDTISVKESSTNTISVRSVVYVYYSPAPIDLLVYDPDNVRTSSDSELNGSITSNREESRSDTHLNVLLLKIKQLTCAPSVHWNGTLVSNDYSFSDKFNQLPELDYARDCWALSNLAVDMNAICLVLRQLHCQNIISPLEYDLMRVLGSEQGKEGAMLFAVSPVKLLDQNHIILSVWLQSEWKTFRLSEPTEKRLDNYFKDDF